MTTRYYDDDDNSKRKGGMGGSSSTSSSLSLVSSPTADAAAAVNVTTLAQLLAALSPTQRRVSFGWILERTTGFARSFVEDAAAAEEEDNDAADDIWDQIAASIDRPELVPVCTETSTDIALYLQTLDYWMVPWSATPFPLLDLIVGTTAEGDRSAAVYRALEAYAREKVGDDAPRIEHLRQLKTVRLNASFSDVDQPKSRLRSVSERLAHILFVFSGGNVACSTLDFVQPWLTTWVFFGAENDSATVNDGSSGSGSDNNRLNEAATILATKRERLMAKLQKCRALYAWFVPHALAAVPSRSAVSSKLVRAALTHSSGTGLEVLEHRFTQMGMKESGEMASAVKRAASASRSGFADGHRFDARFIQVLLEMWPGMIQSAEEVHAVIMYFDGDDEEVDEKGRRLHRRFPGMEGAIELMRRVEAAAPNGACSFEPHDLEEVAEYTMHDQFAAVAPPAEFKKALLRLAAATMTPADARQERAAIEAKFNSPSSP